MQSLLGRFLARLQGPAFTVVDWHGAAQRFGQGPEAFRITLRSPRAAWEILLSPHLGFGEGYMNGTVAVEGDLDAVLDLAYRNQAKLISGSMTWLLRLAARLPRPAWRQRRDIRHHYDIGNDFFRLWLDPTLTYSCAYFHTPDDPLEQAQLQKIDYVLRKLSLQPGESLLDVGCGWGWLLIRAARQYGVRATGITLSQEQCAAGRQHVQELGLSDQVEIRLQSYGDLARSGQTFDKAASIGMFEHVGRPHIPAFMQALERLVRPGGLCLLHTITQRLEQPVSPWISRYIFPGGYIPAWREVVSALADRNFRLLDAEDLRLHYAATLDHWSANFAAVRDEVQARYGEPFVRMWHLYLRGSAAAFHHGALHVHQFLVSHGVARDRPLTRAFLYV